MRGRLVVLLVVPAVAALLAPAPAAAERIESLHAEIQLEASGAFTVEERILWDFGTESRHGIFRDLPVRYGRGRAADYHIAVDVEAVTGASGAPHPFETSRKGAYLRIRIGDPDRTVTGRQEYRIRYRVRRGILFFERHDELYWNATGVEWPVPIDRAGARVWLPEGVATGDVELACFTGPAGAVASDCTSHATPGVVSFEALRAFGPREGLTVVLGLPKGVLHEPSPRERFAEEAADAASPWLLLPLMALAGMGTLWHRQGRDRGARAAVPVRYAPPEGLTPAEVGTLLDERVDDKDVTATVLDLAVRGFLEIEEVESRRFLFLKDRDLRLRKLREPEPGSLRAHEAILLTRLFPSGPEVLASELKDRFYQHLPRIRRALYQELSRDGRFFPAAPDRVRRLWMVAGGVLVALGFFTVHDGADMARVGSFVAAGATVLVFGPFMPRRTVRGRRALEEIQGFREFVERVDADRLERSGGRTAERFERVLPYAVVLGVADAWADAFADVYTEPPRWYRGSDPNRGLHVRHIVGDLGRTLDSLGQSMTSTPRGSGSSGFGGGGSSGGGFGGGGGGSW